MSVTSIRRLVMTVAALLMLAVHSSAGEARAPLKSLEARARQMCEAWIAKDFHATYGLSTPDQRRCMTEDAWIKEWQSSGDSRFTSCRIVRIYRIDREEFPKIHSKCSTDLLPVADAANVKVKIELQLPDGTRDKIDDMLNEWL